MTFLVQGQTREQWTQTWFNKSGSHNSLAGANKTLRHFDEFINLNYKDKNENDILLELKQYQDRPELVMFLNNFIQFLQQKKLGARSIQIYMMFLKSYLRSQGIRLHNDDLKHSLSYPKVIKERRKPLTRQVIAVLLEKSSLVYVCLYLTLGSGGMRLAEALQLRWVDIDFKSTPTMIRLRAFTTKTREERITFVSQECTNKLLELKKKTNPTLDSLVFFKTYNEISTINVESAFNALRKRCGITERYDNGFHHVRLHAFRSFFISQCERINEGLGHALSGHAKYMKEYEQYTEDELREFYLKVEPDLTISNENRLLAVNAKQTEELKSRKELEDKVKKLELEMQRMREGKMIKT